MPDVSWLRDYLGSNVLDGVVVLTGPTDGDADEQCAVRGGEHVRHLVRIVRELPDIPVEPPRLYIVTRGAQPVLAGDPVNLEQAGLRGLIRVIGNEHPQLRASQIDLDGDTDVEYLARQLLEHSDEDETAWRNGLWYAARLSPAPLRPEERQTAVVDHAQDGMGVWIHKPGDPESIELAAFDRVPPGPGEIEVAVTASSVNFADVLIAFGRYPSIDGAPPRLGMDFAGVVTAVGPDVTTHQVGDHVGGFSKNGTWATFVTCDARVAVTLPSGLTDAQAAAVSIAHATAWYGLHDQAGIAAGDRVLIHSATGGVGQAAIAIARAAGAEIFATAGSPQRRQLLRDMGIAHVYDSRSTEFAELIRRDTDEYGVDIVLNSLTGGAQRAGLELLSTGGRFVEIGKRDVYANNRLELFPFRRNLTFHYVDLALLAESRPHRVGDLLGKVYQLVADGELPLPQCTHYPLSRRGRRYSHDERGRAHGKAGARRPPHRAQPGRCTARTGDGFPARWLLHHLRRLRWPRALPRREDGRWPAVAASCLPLAPSRIKRRWTQSSSSRRWVATSSWSAGDIAAPGTADRLVAAATATGLPLRGVLHAAAVAEDATLVNLTDEVIDHEWAPKAYGAWNLHRATTGQPLDWFCSFSSAAALVGAPGHCAYAAANSWLDAFTHWRRAQGLPATTIAWSAWAGIGLATAAAVETTITPEEGAYAFEALLRHDRAYTGYAPVSRTPWLTALAQRSKFAELFQARDESLTDTSKFLAELHALPKEEWPPRLRRLVSDKLSKILRRSIDPDRPLSEYGLDSLANLELRNYLKDETAIRITPSHISTVNGLAEALYEYLTVDGTRGDVEPRESGGITRIQSPSGPDLATANTD